MRPLRKENGDHVQYQRYGKPAGSLQFRTLREVTVPVENVARRDRHIADVKREIREFTHRAASRSHIVRDDGILIKAN